MSDEISTVIKAEMDGVVMAVKATVKAGAFIAQLIKALSEHMKDSRINRAGESRFADIQALSEGEPPVVMIPDKFEKRWKEYCKKNKLHYHTLADLNGSDGKFPVYIPRQELSAVQAFLKECLQETVSESEKTMSELDEKIGERREKLLNASPEERKDLNREIEHLEQAKEEVKKVLDQDRSDLEKEDLSMTFSDYLATGKGTTVEKDPRGVIEGMAEGGQSVPIFTAKDVFEPIRSGALVPDSKVNFIIPETGSMVPRTSHQDEQGLWYSQYSFLDKDQNSITDEKGEPIVFSDQFVTKDEWFNGNAENANFKDLLSKTGILEGTKCEYYATEESVKEALNRYQAYTERFQNVGRKEEQPSFSNADVQKEVEYAAAQKKKGDASAVDGAYDYTFDVAPDKVYQKDGKVTVLLDENRMLHFSDITMLNADESGVKFSIKSTDEIFIEDRNLDKPLKLISAKEGLDMFNENSSKGATENAAEIISTSKSR